MYVPEWGQTTGDEEIVLRARCDRGHEWLVKVALSPLLKLFAWRTAPEEMCERLRQVKEA